MVQGAELLQAAELAGSDGEEDDDLHDGEEDAHLATSDIEAGDSDCALGDDGSDGSDGEEAEEAPHQQQAGGNSDDGEGATDHATTTSDAQHSPTGSTDAAGQAAGQEVVSGAAVVPPLHLPAAAVPTGSGDHGDDASEAALSLEGPPDLEEGSLSGEGSGSEEEGSAEDGSDNEAAGEEEGSAGDKEEAPPTVPTTRPKKRPAPTQPGRYSKTSMDEMDMR